MLKNVLIKYSLVIFVVVIGALLAYTTLDITDVLNQPADTAPATPTSFDQITINKLNRYETSANNINYKNLPQGRINPFFE